jgi:hypothetical protein
MTTNEAAALLADDELTDWEWEIDFKAMAIRRLERLQNEKLTLSELIEEIEDATQEAFTYFCGLDEQAQRRCARDLRDVLTLTMEAKAKARQWARKQIAKRTNPNSLSVRLSDNLRKIKKDFNARHPKQGIF